jgi:hypothetical protein
MIRKMEPRWRKFRYEKPIVAAATGVHSERLFVPGSDESLVWQRASGQGSIGLTRSQSPAADT